MKFVRKWSGAVGLLLIIAAGFTMLYQPGWAGLNWTMLYKGLLIAGAAILLAYVLLNYRAAISFFTTRSVLYGFNTGLVVLAVVGIFVVIEMISEYKNKRWDFSEAKRYSLTDGTLNIIRNLEQSVEITCYFIEGNIEAMDLRDMLDLYVMENQNIAYDFIDPYRNPELVAGVALTQINTVRVRVGEKLEFIAKSGIQEKDITDAIWKVARREVPNIYFVAGHGEKNLDETREPGYSRVRQLLVAQLYEVLALPDLALGVPEDCSVLVLAGPSQNLFQEEWDAIDQYIAGGGRAVVMTELLGRCKEMAPFLARYNVAVKDELVLSNMFIAGSSPIMPVVMSFEGHEITRDLQRANLPMLFSVCQPVEKGEQVSSSIRMEPLVKTTPPQNVSTSRLWSFARPQYGELLGRLQRGLDELDDPIWFLDADKGDREGPITMAMAVTLPEGTRIPRFQSETKAPTGLGLIPTDLGSLQPSEAQEETGLDSSEEESPEEGAGATLGSEGEATTTEESEPEIQEFEIVREAQLVVIGDSDFLENRILSLTPLGGDLLLNSLAWLTEEESLIAVRAKDLKDTPLTVRADQRRFVLVTCIFLIPLCVIVAGITVNMMRKRSV